MKLVNVESESSVVTILIEELKGGVIILTCL